MRERLGDYYDPSGRQTHYFTAQFQCFGKTDEGSNVALLVSVFKDGRWVCDHAWIHRSKQMKRLELEKGDIIEFQAVVGKYPRQGETIIRAEERTWDFSLEHICEMRILRKRSDQ